MLFTVVVPHVIYQLSPRVLFIWNWNGEEWKCVCIFSHLLNINMVKYLCNQCSFFAFSFPMFRVLEQQKLFPSFSFHFYPFVSQCISRKERFQYLKWNERDGIIRRMMINSVGKWKSKLFFKQRKKKRNNERMRAWNIKQNEINWRANKKMFFPRKWKFNSGWWKARRERMINCRSRETLPIRCQVDYPYQALFYFFFFSSFRVLVFSKKKHQLSKYQ